jgi:PleD family two-component response regulator
MIDHEIRRAKRTGSTLCVMILEIDNYEKYLEQNGSTKASQCVRSFAQILNKASSRGGEFVARFGDNKR